MNLTYVGVSFGADPEFFFTKDGKIIGSEKVIPKEGVKFVLERDFEGKIQKEEKIIVIDGVQAEFNILPATCRQIFSSNLRSCFLNLNAEMEKKGVKADFSASVKISKEELATLAKKNQTFGCSPSKNTYKDSKIMVNPLTYMRRSAGGHLHLGHVDERSKTILAKKETVQLLDILLGNTCVLLDRDEGNIERRKVYGRAGEYRLPKHGLEYRTLSNFWLRSYPLMSFALGMARFSLAVSATAEAEKLIFSNVDLAKIQKAINTNDFELAYENFNGIKEIVRDFTIQNEHYYPLSGEKLRNFEFFVEKGIDFWFPHDPMTHWLNGESLNVGWERFIEDIVPTKMPKVAEQPTQPLQLVPEHA